LCKNKGQQVTRKELLEKLNLDIPDEELEEKLEALVKADIIQQGQSNFDYQAVQDNVFDKVFRGVYQKEIEGFEEGEIKKEYRAAFEKLKEEYYSLLGKFNWQKGYFAEYLILEQLKYRARKENELLKSITRYLSKDFDFCNYSRVWRYDSSPEYARGFSVDIFARAENPGDYSIIGEVKSRELKKFSRDEAVEFERKFEEVKKIENIKLSQGFIFSRCGFTREAEYYCKENGIACSEDERWLDSRETGRRR
jgi:hypothetical protein